MALWVALQRYSSLGHTVFILHSWLVPFRGDEMCALTYEIKVDQADFTDWMSLPTI